MEAASKEDSRNCCLEEGVDFYAFAYFDFGWITVRFSYLSRVIAFFTDCYRGEDELASV